MTTLLSDLCQTFTKIVDQKIPEILRVFAYLFAIGQNFPLISRLSLASHNKQHKKLCPNFETSAGGTEKDQL